MLLFLFFSLSMESRGSCVGWYYRRSMYALIITDIYTFDSIERKVEKFEEDIKWGNQKP